jgi:hypothetical protein
MQFIGKSKIGKQYSKLTVIYPIIRLPLQCSEAIGTSVQIYKSEHAGQSIFVIIPDNEEDMYFKLEVAQPNAKVVQPETENDIESRLKALESNIVDIKQLIFQNNSIFNSQSAGEAEKRAPESEPRQFRI